MKELSVFDKHRLAIAKRTINMTPAMLNIMGGMTIEEAETVIKELSKKKK